MILTLSFVAGCALAAFLIRIPERMNKVHGQWLSASEFEKTKRWGRIKSVSALLLSIIFFGVAAVLAMSLVKLNGLSFVTFLLFPGVFLLTNEIPIAIFEVLLETAPRFTNRPIRFEVGEGLRRRGIFRGAVAIGFILVACVISIVRTL